MKKLVMLAMGLFVATSSALAQPGMMAGRGHDQFLKELNLTDVQQKEFDKIMVDHQKKMVDQMAKIASARIDMGQLLKADEPQKSAIEKKSQEISGLLSQVQSERLNHWFNVNKQLTPDQQKVWKNALEGHMAMGQGPGMGMHRRGGQSGFGRGMMQHRGKMQGRGMMREKMQMHEMGPEGE
ncbi:MAG: hypothetical protein A2X67_08625 [Ignavibacteria bacterium GWA2_55_11]|nr:MAG: hypothetical protein A2X67_08625 [Ignavibacteria bacterium GWA2_55_11]OGU44013.1 MAG: hypothetical protein A2X68_02430 [Ignavibacteria bacterium GWC2_56_12]OGU72702.1 MAG: hypothetical protein A3G43_05890 [Ignavibacteria bacterium RIFCSPLOWO2_12_FULL_56_21]HAV22768.1 hypothetical protein [Bacteroidota bacterium]